METESFDPMTRRRLWTLWSIVHLRIPLALAYSAQSILVSFRGTTKSRFRPHRYCRKGLTHATYWQVVEHVFDNSCAIDLDSC